MSQLTQDFKDYGWKADHYVHQIMGGTERYVEAPVVISTWQSIYKRPKKFFERFDVIIGDEAHLYKAKSLTGILNKCHDAKYRVGTDRHVGWDVQSSTCAGRFIWTLRQGDDHC